MTTAIPMPTITPLNQPYWSGLDEGELRYQRCNVCGNAWLPAREECPRCLEDDWTWRPSAGRGRIISWVVYHQAVHPSFADRLPYNVAVVELDEGPRVITNIKADPDRLSIDQPVVVAIEREGDVSVARFSPA
jgi:uncharacterized OB-fold protein